MPELWTYYGLNAEKLIEYLLIKRQKDFGTLLRSQTRTLVKSKNIKSIYLYTNMNYKMDNNERISKSFLISLK